MTAPVLGQEIPPIQKSEEIRIINAKEYYIHTVEQGHTLYSISKIYDVSMDEIVFENPNSKYGLSIGQELRIPVKSRDDIVRESYANNNFDFFYHIAKSGENFKRISDLYAISERKLRRANTKLNEPLKAGQYLKIPVEEKTVQERVQEKKAVVVSKEPEKVTKPEEKFIFYTTRAGDNLYRIALKYGVSIDEIKQLNRGVGEKLPTGKSLRIPKQKGKVSYINHRVKKREKITKIAKNYNVSLVNIFELNPRLGRRLQTGQIVKIPSSYEEVIEEVTEVAVTEEMIVEIPMNRDSLNCYADPTNSLKTYHVALLIPLYLEEADSLKFDIENPNEEILEESSFRFLQFYYGSLIAVDSLKKQGLNIELHVYDVDNDMAKAMKVINLDEMRSMDLIIGPFFSRIFPLASNFARIFGIPIVNPLSQRSDIISNNSRVYKYQPTDRFQIEDVKNIISQDFKDSKIFLLDKEEGSYNDPFNKYANILKEVSIDSFKVSNLDLYNLALEKAEADTALMGVLTRKAVEEELPFEMDSVHPYLTVEGMNLATEELELFIDDTTSFGNEIVKIHFASDSLRPFAKYASVFRNNVVILNTEDNVFALDILTRFNIVHDTMPITIIGVPNWEDFENMNNEMYQNLNTHYLSSTFVDYKDRGVISFIKRYRAEYLSEPVEYAFIGFDLSWYFMNALLKFGNNFNDCLQFYDPDLIRPQVKFETNGKGEGYENVYWDAIKFRNYQLQKIDLRPTLNQPK